MIGKLYGIGVGPGDPELMTLKAVRIVKQSDIIVIPASGKKINAAYTIAKGAIPEIDQMEIMEVAMPMTKDEETLRQSHEVAANQIKELLEAGKNIAFLTLGDPTIYSTYIYIHEILKNSGFDTEIIPGIPSFCAASASLNEGLTEASECLHIIPASYEGMDNAMSLKGTKVLMKSGKSLAKVKEEILKNPDRWDAKMVERCGMKGERIFLSADVIDEDASYFSIVVVKDKENI